MAKKTKKSKITDTLVNQLQETPTPIIEERNPEVEVVGVKEKPKEQEEKKVIPHKKPRISRQSSKFFDEPVSPMEDSATIDVNLGISGVL